MDMRFFEILILCLAFTGAGSAEPPLSPASPLELKTEAELKAWSASQGRTEGEWKRRRYLLDPVLKKKWEIEAQQAFFRNEVTVWVEVHRSATQSAHSPQVVTKGFCAVMDNAIGKTQPITFVVVADTQAVLAHTAVMAYREAYGGAVGGQGWNRRLRGMGTEKPLRVGKEVDAIAGASLSVHALAKGYRKAAWIAQAVCREAL